MAELSEQPRCDARILAAEPQLFVSDIAASLEFFDRKLGCSTEFGYGEPPIYAQVERDGARINLRCADTPAIGPARRDREQLLSVALTVATPGEIAAPASGLEAAGVAVFRPMTEEPRGARNVIVRDPHGNLLLLAGPAA
jgi:catechol 2,3-dioxygenase-like lactoylglutathione lyase family enzyme